MYDFHYKKKYAEKAQFLFTITMIHWHIILKQMADFSKDKNLFDNSDFSEYSKFYFKENKKSDWLI